MDDALKKRSYRASGNWSTGGQLVAAALAPPAALAIGLTYGAITGAHELWFLNLFFTAGAAVALAAVTWIILTVTRCRSDNGMFFGAALGLIAWYGGWHGWAVVDAYFTNQLTPLLAISPYHVGTYVIGYIEWAGDDGGFLWWIGEILLLVITPAVIGAGFEDAPFCELCKRWASRSATKKLGSLDAVAVQQRLKAGDYGFLTPTPTDAGASPMTAKVRYCGCDEGAGYLSVWSGDTHYAKHLAVPTARLADVIAKLKGG